jgi:hypothetical protein
VSRRGIEGEIRADKIALAVAGHSSVLAGMAGLRLPVVSYALQAMVTEPVKPLLNTVTMSPALGAYWSQSDKGEIVLGGALDHFPSYAQRGCFAMSSQAIAATCEMLPSLARLRLLGNGPASSTSSTTRARSSAPRPCPGSTSIAAGAPAASRRYRSAAGRCAHVLATGRDHELAEPFQLERFRQRTVDRRGGGVGDCALNRLSQRAVPTLAQRTHWVPAPDRVRGRPAAGTTAMMQLRCPWCGDRPENEFHCGGTTAIARPPPRCTDDDGPRTCSCARTRRASTPSAGATRSAAGCGSTCCATR